MWDKIGGNFSDAVQELRPRAIDGHYYFVPLYNYPWVVFYNKSVWAAKGYTVPDHLGRLRRAAKKMKTDGLVPIAFGTKDGWPALGTFDILNMRINGYDYHIKLMKHKVAVDRPERASRSSSSGARSCPTSRPAPTAGSGRTPPRRWRTSRPA